MRDVMGRWFFEVTLIEFSRPPTPQEKDFKNLFWYLFCMAHAPLHYTSLPHMKLAFSHATAGRRSAPESRVPTPRGYFYAHLFINIRQTGGTATGAARGSQVCSLSQVCLICHSTQICSVVSVSRVSRVTDSLTLSCYRYSVSSACSSVNKRKRKTKEKDKVKEVMRRGFRYHFA